MGAFVGAIVLAAACGGQAQVEASPSGVLTRATNAPSAAATLAQNTAAPAAVKLSDDDAKLVGTWRLYSSRLFYDSGGGSGISQFGPPMVVSADGTWQFETSRGKWSTSQITPDDWKKWGSNPYGPTRKIVLEGYNKVGADGPIEPSSSGARVDFFWVIYRTGPPDTPAGSVHSKYGH